MTNDEKDLSERIEGLLQSLEVPGTVGRAAPEAFGFEAKFQKVDRAKRSSIGQMKQLAIFRRDHFIDRYTGERLFFPGVLLLLGDLFPDAFPKPSSAEGWRVGRCHWIYWRLWPTVDHVKPVAGGGHPTDETNLVTTSQMINTAKSAWTGHEVPKQIRFEAKSVAEVQAQNWDGMFAWFVDYLERNPAIRGASRELGAWIKTTIKTCEVDAKTRSHS